MPPLLNRPVSDRDVQRGHAANISSYYMCKTRAQHAMMSVSAPQCTSRCSTSFCSTGCCAARFACQLFSKWCCTVPPSVFTLTHVHSVLLCCSPQRARPGKEKMCVSSMWDDAPKALAAGDELCISYNYGWRHPDPQAALDQCYAAFLTRGFVPFEYLPARRSRKGRILAPAWPGVGTILVIMPTHAIQEPVRSR